MMSMRLFGSGVRIPPVTVRAVRIKTVAATLSITVAAGIEMGATEMLIAFEASVGGWYAAYEAERVTVGCWSWRTARAAKPRRIHVGEKDLGHRCRES